MIKKHAVVAIAFAFTACTEFGMTPITTGGDSPAETGLYEAPEQTEWTTEAPQETRGDTTVYSLGETGDPAPDDDCDETSDLVYIIDREKGALYLFNPPSLSFEFLGDLDCGLYSGTPASMSVSRDGVAYVRYSDDSVYAVNVKTMECLPTSYQSNFGSFGMGYATESKGVWQDDLYIANANQLAMVDTSTWSLTVLGQLPSQSELTGNGDGELWAMLPLEVPAALMKLDKGTGSPVEKVNLSGMPNPSNIDTFAFATWGGDFWLFIREYGMGQSTDVYKVSLAGVMSKVSTDTGMDVVGAGVSTCAPTE